MKMKTIAPVARGRMYFDNFSGKIIPYGNTMAGCATGSYNKIYSG